MSSNQTFTGEIKRKTVENDADLRLKNKISPNVTFQECF